MTEAQTQLSFWRGPIFFIVGCGRSGTTWVRNIFNAHPAVIAGEESYFFCDVTPQIRRAYAAKTGPTGLHRYMAPEGLARGIELLFRRVAWERAQRKPDAIWFGEKTPAHIHRLDDIVEVLPEAKFVHVVRNALDVVASMLDAARSWSPNPHLTAQMATETWRTAVEKGLAAEHQWPGRVLRIQYEDLTGDGIPTIIKMFDFLDLHLQGEEAARIFEETRFERYTNGRRAGEAGGEGKFYRLGLVGGWDRSLSLQESQAIRAVSADLDSRLGYSE
jgi:predicted transcriptional regulator